jgi:hypothetical protein
MKTRWVYSVDALHLILSRVDAADTVLKSFEQRLVSDIFIIISRVLTSLALFSRVMESGDKRLCNVIPAAQEILTEWRGVWDKLRHVRSTPIVAAKVVPSGGRPAARCPPHCSDRHGPPLMFNGCLAIS